MGKESSAGGKMLPGRFITSEDGEGTGGVLCPVSYEHSRRMRWPWLHLRA